ncbi:MAG: GNAT family N-acetyltransferase, partial [Planctomycetaceae bacterium]|nr:GNAT family N-acetyltransferase [Planctomycetaceae bacterium]
MWTIRRATIDDLETLVSLRINFLEEVNNSGEGLREALAAYFRRMLPSENYIAWLAIHEGEPIGTAGFVFLDKPPSGKNPWGREAYVMNVYTLPGWRKQGVGAALLNVVL